MERLFLRAADRSQHAVGSLQASTYVPPLVLCRPAVGDWASRAEACHLQEETD